MSSIPPDSNNTTACADERGDHLASSGLSLDQVLETDLPFVFGRYELQALVGQGGMARVFRAELKGPAGFRKPVALKVLKAAVGADAKQNELFGLIREACLGGLLQHPHIVDVYELGDVNGQLFISMELVDGLTLSELVRSNAQLPPSVVLEIGIGIAAGLAKAHSFESGGERLGLVHRDLKPANILLSWDGAIKIADLGIAIMQRNDENTGREPSEWISGTPSYMSPEQVQGGDLDGRSDLFSLAILIAETALGRNPLGNGFVMNRLLSGRTLKSPLLGVDEVQALDEIAAGLGEMVLKGLDPDRGNRYQDAEQMLEALQDLQETVGYKPRLRTCLARLRAGDTQAWSVDDSVDVWAQTFDAFGADIPDSHGTTLQVGPVSSSNIAPPVNTFVGRALDLSELGNLFATSHRLVTVKGMGGAGKTRLCTHYARQVLDTLPGGAWFVDLTEARTAMGVLQATATVLGVPLTADGSFEAVSSQLGHAIAAKGVSLLVLDNFEQVIEHASVTLVPWMKMAPEGMFLVTSRQRLDVESERVFPLEPMSESEGMDLFELRALAAGAQWQVCDEVRQSIAQIVKEVDGLPLAIELAAARANLLSPTQLLERLTDRFKLLKSRLRGVSERQTTLRGLIDWSWNLLEPWEQAALVQLSVFHGGFAMESAEEVLDLSHWPEAPWSLDVVGSLFDKSLLYSREASGQPRFGMYASIQQYAAAKLESECAPMGGEDAQNAVQWRHATHFSRFGVPHYLRSLNTHGGVLRRKLLALEFENLLLGVQTALDNGHSDKAAGCALAAAEVFRLNGPFSDGVSLLTKVLEGSLPAETKWQLYRSTGILLRLSGLAQEALKHHQQALVLAKELGDRRREGITLEHLAGLCSKRNRVSEALHHYQQALNIQRDVGDRVCEGIVMGNLASLYRAQGQVADASEHYDGALRIHREVGNRREEGVVLGNLANLHREQGRVAEALEHFHQAIAIHREVGEVRFEGVVLGNLANLHHDQGRIAEALEHYHQAIAIHRRVGERRFEGITVGDLAILHREAGRFGDALAHFRQALDIARGFNNQRQEGIIHGHLALLYQQQGDFSEALSRYQRALGINRKIGDRRSEGHTLGNLAGLHQHLGRLGKAEDNYRAALAIHRAVGERGFEGMTLGNLGDLQYARGDYETAEANLHEAILICDELWPVAAGAFRASLALIRGHQGDFESARKLLAVGEPQLRDVYALELGKLLCKKALLEHMAGDAETAQIAIEEARLVATEISAGPDSELGNAISEARSAMGL